MNFSDPFGLTPVCVVAPTACVAAAGAVGKGIAAAARTPAAQQALQAASARAHQLGRAGEAFVQGLTGLAKNTAERLGSRIPDFVDRAANVFHEVKNTQRVGLTAQIREMIGNLGEGQKLIIHVRAEEAQRSPDILTHTLSEGLSKSLNTSPSDCGLTMEELKLLVETDSPLGDAAAAQRVLEVLTGGRKWAPDRFGTHEPLRDRFDADAPDAFIAAWSGALLNARMGSFHFQNRERYQATVMWWIEGSDLDSLHFTFRIRSGDRQRLSECVTLAHQLFEAANGQYGYLCNREEYWSKNVIGAWTGRSGRPEGGRAQGTDRKRHLPGVYWANFFGPIYAAFFTEERLESAPAYSKLTGQQSWVLLTSATPDEWDAPESVRCASAIREHLGADAFFNINEPERPTRAPVFERSGSKASASTSGSARKR